MPQETNQVIVSCYFLQHLTRQNKHSKKNPRFEPLQVVKEMTCQLILYDHPRSWNLGHSTTQASKDVFFQRYSWRWFKLTSFSFQLGWNCHLCFTKVEKLTHWLLDALIGSNNGFSWFLRYPNVLTCKAFHKRFWIERLPKPPTIGNSYSRTLILDAIGLVHCSHDIKLDLRVNGLTLLLWHFNPESDR